MMHKWVYRNPYDRTCRACGRNEVSHCLGGNWFASWWEVFRDGDDSCDAPKSMTVTAVVFCLAIILALLISACGGHGQDNKQGTTVANDKDKQEQTR